MSLIPWQTNPCLSLYFFYGEIQANFIHIIQGGIAHCLSYDNMSKATLECIISSLASGRFWYNFGLNFNLISMIHGWGYLLWNCHQVIAIASRWRYVNIGSDNGLMLAGNKPLPEPVLTQIYVTISCHSELSVNCRVHMIQIHMIHTSGMKLVVA